MTHYPPRAPEKADASEPPVPRGRAASSPKPPQIPQGRRYRTRGNPFARLLQADFAAQAQELVDRNVDSAVGEQLGGHFTGDTITRLQQLEIGAARNLGLVLNLKRNEKNTIGE